MVRQPLIRFRYAIKKAAKAGLGHVSETTSAARAPEPKNVGSQMQKSVGNSNVERTSTRIEKPIPRAPLTDDEMDAIMLGGAV